MEKDYKKYKKLKKRIYKDKNLSEAEKVMLDSINLSSFFALRMLKRRFNNNEKLKF